MLVILQPIIQRPPRGRANQSELAIGHTQRHPKTADGFFSGKMILNIHVVILYGDYVVKLMARKLLVTMTNTK